MLKLNINDNHKNRFWIKNKLTSALAQYAPARYRNANTDRPIQVVYLEGSDHIAS